MKRYLTLLVLPFAALVVPAPAQAAACSGTTGVTVVVDFGSHTSVGCAPGDPANGYDALNAAGFSTVLAQGNGAGALCRIDGFPTGSTCSSMPPANAYWAYFHAKRGGTWAYSDTGGGSYDPAPGSVEGWSFGSGKAPSTAPPAATRAIKPTPKSTPKPKPTVSAHATPVVGPVATSPTPTKHPTPAASTSTASTGPAPNGPGPSLTPTTMIQNRAAGAAEKQAPAASSHGVSWVWGVALLAVLAAAGSVTAVRRRRS